MSALTSFLKNNSVDQVPFSGRVYLADMSVKKQVGLSVCVCVCETSEGAIFKLENGSELQIYDCYF